MEPVTDDELRLLREQAFGRGTDGDVRATALARLAEIEAEATATPPDGTADRPVAATDADEASEAVASVAADDASADSSPVAAWLGRTPSRRIVLVWAASLVLAVAVTLGVVAAVSMLDVRRVAVLHVDPDGEMPQDAGMSSDEVLVFDEFLGLSVALHPGSTFGYEPDGRCVYGMAPGEQPGAYFGFGACSARSFPAIATMIVEETSPAPLRDAFPVGTALQFELSGDQIIVRAD